MTPITGTYFKTDNNGKVTKEEVPFVASNVFLTQKTLDKLLASGDIEVSEQKGTLLNLVWSVGPFIILGVGYLLIPGIIIYFVWRAVNKGSAGVRLPMPAAADAWRLKPKKCKPTNLKLADGRYLAAPWFLALMSVIWESMSRRFYRLDWRF